VSTQVVLACGDARTLKLTFVGHPAYNTDTLCADLHRFAFLLGAGDGEDLFGEPTS